MVSNHVTPLSISEFPLRKRYPRRLGDPYPPKPCETCGSDFIPPRRDSRNCPDCKSPQKTNPTCGKCGKRLKRPGVIKTGPYAGRTARPAKYCIGCRPSKPVRVDPGELNCDFCGKSFKRGKRGPVGRYCSTRCRHRPGQIKRLPPDIRDCERCGKPFSRAERGFNAKLCSYACRRTYQRKNNPITNCEVCGIELVSPCSQAMRWCAEHKPPDAVYSRRRRNWLKDGGESIDHLTVYERDDWICGICQEPVDPDLSHPDQMAASLDHIIPLAKGGKHVYGNVQCAHWICNCRKSTKEG